MRALFVFLVVWFCQGAFAAKDYYKILGISRKASTKDIKQAYRDLSREWHPDKNKSPDASDKFSEIAEAYEILFDEDMRKVFDRGGEDAVKKAQQRDGGYDQDPFDFFGGFGGFNQRGGGGSRKPKTESMRLNLRVTLKTLYDGDHIRLSYTRRVVCLDANECVETKASCEGPGVGLKMQNVGPGYVMQTQVADSSCVGRKKAWKKKCRACPDGPQNLETAMMYVDIPRGAAPDEQIVIEEMGPHLFDNIPGDLLLTLRQSKHPRFQRQGADLWHEHTITLEEALLGFDHEILHVDDKTMVPLRSVTVSADGRQIVLPGKGMPRFRSDSEFGDMIVRLRVSYPVKIPTEHWAAVRTALKGATYTPPLNT